MEQALDLSSVFALEPHGPDKYVAESPTYSWGRIYGGLVVAQALWAATQSVQPEHRVHSLHAYFILGGEIGEPVRYEVDRVRNGRSFSTRRVVARQSAGAILTLGCSFQAAEEGPESQAATMPQADGPEGIETYLDAGAERRDVSRSLDPPRSLGWVRFPIELPDDPRIHPCALAYLSDVNPMEAITMAHPEKLPEGTDWDAEMMGASLDHGMWFHRPARADRWLLHDLTGHGLVGNRGLATGLVFAGDGTHVATIAQEGLLRRRRKG